VDLVKDGVENVFHFVFLVVGVRDEGGDAYPFFLHNGQRVVVEFPQEGDEIFSFMRCAAFVAGSISVGSTGRY